MTCILDDDESDIEAEIQRELDALEEDSLHIEDVEDDSSISTTNELKEDFLPDSLQEYFKLLQSRTEGAEEEVKECEVILEKLPADTTEHQDEALLAKRIKEELGEEYGENPLVLRDKVISELEEAELSEKRERLAEVNTTGDNQLALDVFRPGIIEEVHALEKQAQQQLRELEEKQAAKDQERKGWIEERRKEDEARHAREKEARTQRQNKFEADQRLLLKEQKALQTKLEKEAREEEGKLQQMEEQFQVELMAIEEERKKQNEAFEESQRIEAEYQQQKLEAAATKLQKHYRGFRVRKQYQPMLEARRLERMKRRTEELDAIERVERKLREEAEKKKTEEEQRKKEQYERKKQEEHEERKRHEEAKKERQLKEEQRIRDEEKRRREAEEKNRAEEEEKKKQEEAKKKKEEEQKQREAEEKRIMEEQRKKAEEENRRKIEEEKRQEEERKRKEWEEKMREEERKRKEAEERGMEERKREEEWKDALKKLEEERKRKETQSRKDEESKIPVKEQQHAAMEGKIKMVPNKVALKEEKERTNSQLDKREEVENRSTQDIRNDRGQMSKGHGLVLRKELEARRQQWVKEHTPWSTISTVRERSQLVTKTRPRRTFSASKHLPVLSEEQMVKSSPPNTPLYKVKIISLEGLPSCSMQSLSRCPDLRSLRLHNCGVLAVEGLEQCKQLQELHMEDNKVEAINCKDLSKLEDVSLQNNNLASVHGLEGCGAVRSLDLSNNNITRIGDLSSCGKMQRLHLDNNQLINTKGLSSLVCLQSLSLAHNHVARVSDIDKCFLLQALNLQANNLQEPPHLMKCVLLRELRLDDNSISSLDSLSTAWLPLLQLLSVSQNSLPQLAPLGNLVMLDTLDISNNLVSDTESLIPGLQECGRLKTLKIIGNPVHEEPNCRTEILEALPWLVTLDGDDISDNKVVCGNLDPFSAMCLQQLQTQDALLAEHQKEIRNADSQTRDPEAVVKRLSLMSQHNKEWFELAVKHLQEHENFDPNNISLEIKKDRNINTRTIGEASETCLTKERRETNIQAHDYSIQNVAATKIQALWRGWYIRHLIDVNTNKWMAAVTIQAAWRGHWVRSQLKRKPRVPWDPQKNSAATVIQAHFRGQRVRRRLADALQAAQFYHDGDEEFDYDEEVDLSAFDFDESSLEQGWTPSETPQLPSRGPVLKLPGHSSKGPKSSGLNRDMLNDPAAPRPRQAWRSVNSPFTDYNEAPFTKATTDQDTRSVTSGMQSHMSHRAEELTNEWGFRNSETAELMMRRARKMKYNPARRKKMLDPNKRLALFKKLEETNKLHDVKPPATRRQPPNRVDYFAARDAMANHMASTSPSTEQQTKEQLTYSWVYKQAVVHEDEENNIMSDQREYEPETRNKKTSPQKSSRSPVSLPHMDPVVLSGRSVSLVSSASEISPESPSTRSHSFSSEGRVRFPAIKTHSVPNLLAARSTREQPVNTEKSNSAGARITRETRYKR